MVGRAVGGGAGVVGRAAGGVLDRVGAVSPRGRRIAVYTGAGVLGVAGVVEWPVAITGAAVAWLTQPRSPERVEEAEQAESVGTGARGAGDVPTPKVMASTGGAAHADTPSAKLPTHRTTTPGRAGTASRATD
ncbi:hypothetical protein [Streptomyces justiciae]|uniref:MFS transporter n=1 Tax=Streptomyces justiciae TaxID=2780140 RepID=A0ABU3LTB2_9ACTN|nr:hypothetical protein [Streptomyces justiciae]MDT7842487.1 hypothetical protein [Streptomyces justiciae]